MKKNLIRVFCLVLVLTLVMGVLPAMAADEITVYVSVSAQGVPALTKDGAPASLLSVKVPAGSTVEDAVIAAHAKFCPAGAEGFQMADSDWGLSMVLIWGAADGVGGFYVNGSMPMDNMRNVKANNGDVIELVLYRPDWSDSYARFNAWYAEATVGAPLTLTLTHEAFDENWNPSPAPLAGAVVKTADGKELGVTDDQGSITLFFDAPGSCIVTAESADLAITAPCCYVTVAAASGLIAPAPAAKTYVVQPGDTLWKIAKNALGSGFRWGEIFEMNTDLVKNPRMIYVGQTLRLPA